MPKKRLREYEASDATNISLRHKNSPFSDGTSAALFADKVLLVRSVKGKIVTNRVKASNLAHIFLRPYETN